MSQVLSSIHYIYFRNISGSTTGHQIRLLPQAPSDLVTPLNATLCSFWNLIWHLLLLISTPRSHPMSNMTSLIEFS